jgi:hypothetical protein
MVEERQDVVLTRTVMLQPGAYLMSGTVTSDSVTPAVCQMSGVEGSFDVSLPVEEGLFGVPLDDYIFEVTEETPAALTCSVDPGATASLERLLLKFHSGIATIAAPEPVTP